MEITLHNPLNNTTLVIQKEDVLEIIPAPVGMHAVGVRVMVITTGGAVIPCSSPSRYFADDAGVLVGELRVANAELLKCNEELRTRLKESQLRVHNLGDLINSWGSKPAPRPAPLAPRPAEVSGLAAETRSALTTDEAARYLNRRPQTLRGWACLKNGPLHPIRVNGRLAWPVAELRRVLEVLG